MAFPPADIFDWQNDPGSSTSLSAANLETIQSQAADDAYARVFSRAADLEILQRAVYHGGSSVASNLIVYWRTLNDLNTDGSPKRTYAVAGNILYKTTDDITSNSTAPTWTAIYTATGKAQINQVMELSNGNILILVQPTAGQAYCELWRSTDGGTTFTGPKTLIGGGQLFNSATNVNSTILHNDSWFEDTAVMTGATTGTNNPGTVYMGEYGDQPGGVGKRIYKSTDYGETWDVVLVKTDVRHWHLVQRDLYHSSRIWVNAGDGPDEVRFGYTDDYFATEPTWLIVHDGSEATRNKGRITTLLFTPTAVIYGSDNLSAADDGQGVPMYRLDRQRLADSIAAGDSGLEQGSKAIDLVYQGLRGSIRGGVLRPASSDGLRPATMAMWTQCIDTQEFQYCEFIASADDGYTWNIVDRWKRDPNAGAGNNVTPIAYTKLDGRNVFTVTLAFLDGVKDRATSSGGYITMSGKLQPVKRPDTRVNRTEERFKRSSVKRPILFREPSGIAAASATIASGSDFRTADRVLQANVPFDYVLEDLYIMFEAAVAAGTSTDNWTLQFRINRAGTVSSSSFSFTTNGKGYTSQVSTASDASSSAVLRGAAGDSLVLRAIKHGSPADLPAFALAATLRRTNWI